MATTLRVGDRVQLRSGGPEMVIEQGPGSFGGYEGEAVSCCWFDGGGLQRAFFPIAVLAPIQRPTA